MKTAGLTILVSLGALAQDVTFGPVGGSRVELIVEKTGLMNGKKHVLIWEKFEGRFSVAPARASLSIEAASVKVLDDWINDGKKEDVRKETVGKDVLNAAKFPRIEFVSTAVTGDVKGAFQIAGTLTVRGIGKAVTIAVRRNEAGVYEGEAAFPMSAFGIQPPKALLGAIGTKDLMTLRVRVAGS
ncbi:MAG: YceI family protein [Acidobacteria bacterium]|nr:YceI family protein [Acidobacteriota bacterium]